MDKDSKNEHLETQNLKSCKACLQKDSVIKSQAELIKKMLEKEEKLEKINEKMKAENSDLNVKLQSSTANLSHQKSMQEKSD